MPETEVKLWTLTDYGPLHGDYSVKRLINWVRNNTDKFLGCSKHQTTEANFFITDEQHTPEVLRLKRMLYSFRGGQNLLDTTLFNVVDLYLLEAEQVLSITPQELREYALKHQNKPRKGAEALLKERLTEYKRDLATFRTDRGRLAIFYLKKPGIELDTSRIPYLSAVSKSTQVK